jgi:hypothetical protein
VYDLALREGSVMRPCNEVAIWDNRGDADQRIGSTTGTDQADQPVWSPQPQRVLEENKDLAADPNLRRQAATLTIESIGKQTYDSNDRVHDFQTRYRDAWSKVRASLKH